MSGENDRYCGFDISFRYEHNCFLQRNKKKMLYISRIKKWICVGNEPSELDGHDVKDSKTVSVTV